jgi:GT2 family glycosyltransferase
LAQGKKIVKMVDIIIPIYSGYAETVACLSSVLDAENLAVNEIVAIYDAGPDAQLLTYLEGLSSQNKITLLINSINVGFVKTVNRGMALHPERDVVLLNSDTRVANNWLDRLLECARSDTKIATVTPFSNNAEICSFPNICQSSELPPGWEVAEVDSIFAHHVTPAAIDIPTAIGFCMYISRKALKDVGDFNEAIFQRGYGEENDFCRRLAARNWRNVLCTNVFVYHKGSVSFKEEKASLVSCAMEILDKLYPDYHRLVHEFIEADPPQKYRIQAQLALLDSDRPRALCITHNLDGGTAKHVRELTQYLSKQVYLFVVRMLSGSDIELSIKTEWYEIKIYFIWPKQAELFLQTIACLGVTRAHIHHIKNIEFFVRYLIKHTNLEYDITLHDYYLINGNPALTDKSGKFCADKNSRDVICAEHSVVPLNYTADQWRIFTGDILRNAARIFVPSCYSARLFAEYFFALDFIVAPHPDWEVESPYPAVNRAHFKSGEKFKVVILGALGLEKGADILEQVTLLGEKFGHSIEFHLLGYAYRELNRAVIVHGAYDDKLLDKKLADIAPHIVWFPCQWPETYSYTLSACLRGGYPVLAPALGAFIERLSDRPLSWLQPFPTTPDEWLSSILRIARDEFLNKSSEEYLWAQPRPLDMEGFSYARDYAEPFIGKHVPQASLAAWASVVQQLKTKPAGNNANFRRELLLRGLLRLRQTRSMRIFLRFIPFSLQRRIKRALSPRALHHIARDLL